MADTGLIAYPTQPSFQSQIESLQRELFNRNRQLAEAEESLRQERNRANAMEQGVAALRVQLRPLHQALLMVFGEIDSMDVESARHRRRTPPRGSSGRRVSEVRRPEQSMPSWCMAR